MKTEKKNTYVGNFYWLLEAFKIPTRESTFNVDINSENIKDFKFYECIVFNYDEEDVLFVQKKDKLYEYLSNDRINLISKLISVYEKRLCSSDKNYKLPRLNSLNKIPNFQSSSNLNSPSLLANLLISYKDHTTLWKYDYDLKKMLFNLKFLPDYQNIKLIRIFPTDVKDLKTKLYTYFDKENEFIEDKIKRNNGLNFKKEQDEMFTVFVENLKNIFYEKYFLRLIKLDLETFELNGKVFISDVKEMLFEKQNFKLIKLKTEGLILKNKHQIQSIKDAPNSKDLKSFFFSMIKFYEKAKSSLKIEKYLTLPKKDDKSDEVFKILRPDCPYLFSKLIGNEIDRSKFAKYASNKLNKNV